MPVVLRRQDPRLTHPFTPPVRKPHREQDPRCSLAAPFARYSAMNGALRYGGSGKTGRRSEPVRSRPLPGPGHGGRGPITPRFYPRRHLHNAQPSQPQPRPQVTLCYNDPTLSGEGTTKSLRNFLGGGRDGASPFSPPGGRVLPRPLPGCWLPAKQGGTIIRHATS